MSGLVECGEDRGGCGGGALASTLTPNDRVLRLVLILPLYPLRTMV